VTQAHSEGDFNVYNSGGWQWYKNSTKENNQTCQHEEEGELALEQRLQS
jgi:hypothetical protein